MGHLTSVARATVGSGDLEAAAGEPNDAPLEIGERVDHFQILRLLGRGGMGEVYVARDTLLGRRVALKLIHPKYLGSPEAIAGFLEEARTTAKFSHPHIVAIHAVGEHQGRPYVALEFLEGENLRKRMMARRLSHQATLRVALAVAEALDEAHRGGVLHLDLKPENVMIPEDGRVRVVDFGLARPAKVMESGEVRARDERTGVWGTPAYMAPEQWLRQKPTSATDVWGLGMLLFELFSDWLPYDLEGTKTKLMEAVCDPAPVPRIERYAEVPSDVAELVAACLEKDPRQRPRVSEVADALREMLFRGATRPADDEGPFRGLLPFTERHVGLFFGREAEVNAFVERIRFTPVLPVVGPSGAGKSSFVQAGVLPRLREEGDWLFIKLRPGSHPFESLAAHLLRADRDTIAVPAPKTSTPSLRDLPSEDVPATEPAASDVRRLTDRLLEAPQRLSLELTRIAREHRSNVLVFVDQVEELFTHCEDAKERRAFMEAICTAAEDPDDPVRVVFTVRDDYLGRLALGPLVTRSLAQVTVIQRLRRDALAETLTKPLASVGYRLEDDALVEEMVACVEDAPGALPMLQFAARQLWERRDRVRRMLLRAAYAEMGGVEGALAAHADGVLDAMSAEQVELARELLLRLVTDDRTRERLPKVACLAGLGSEAEPVLTRLTQARLVVSTQRARESGGQAMLELAHDALIGSWGTLARWLDESREELAFVHEAGQAAALWDKRGRLPEELWRGEALSDALRRLGRTTTELGAVTREFLAAASERERQRVRHKRILHGSLLVGTALLAAVFAVVAWVVGEKEREATRQRDLAEHQRAATLRESARAALSQGNVLEARAKLRLALDVEDDPAARALFWQLSQNPIVWQKKLGDRVFGVSFTADAREVVAGCADEAIYVFDRVTGAMRVLHGNGDQVLGVAMAPSGAQLFTMSTGGAVRAWDTDETSPLRLLGAHAQRPTAIRVSPDGASVATASHDGTVRIWPTSPTGSPRVIELGGEVGAVDFEPKSARVVAAVGAKLWSIAADGTKREEPGRGGANVSALRVSPDGAQIAVGRSDGRVSLVPLGGEGERVLEGHLGAVWSVAFDGDGRHLASGGDDGTLRLWDATTGRLVLSLLAHEEQVTGVDLSHDGRYAVTGSFDGTVRVWDLHTGGARAATGGTSPLYGHAALSEPLAGARGLAFSPDGKTIAAGSYDGRVRLWNVAAAEVERTLVGHSGRIFEVAFSHDGNVLASSSADRSARLWSVATGSELRVLAGHAGPVVGVAFSPDDQLLATGSKDTTVRLWEVEGGGSRVLSGHAGEVNGVTFSADGALLASGGRDVRVWNVASGELETVLEGHTDAVLGVRFMGAALVSGSTDGTLRRWDLATGQGQVVGRHPQRVYWIDVHDERISASSSDGIARLWRRDGTEPVLLRGHSDEVNHAVFSPSGQLVATAGDDGTVRVWHAHDGRPFWRTAALTSTPSAILTHLGWTSLADGAPRPRGAWARAIDSRARWAEQVGEVMCLLGHDGAVELWHVGDDVLTARVAGPFAALSVASGGCVARGAARALLLSVSGESVPLGDPGPVSAVAASADAVLVAGARSITRFDARGRRLGAWEASPGITAVGPVGDDVAVGYRDGHLQLFAARDGAVRPLAFQGIASSAVSSITEGPSGTLAAGYDNGFVGLWSQRDGALLASRQLHGRVSHLTLQDQRLVVATDLGAHLVWDLRAFQLPYCELLRAVWREVPVVWDAGHPVVRPPPVGHRCGASP